MITIKKKKINWNKISSLQTLTINFLREYKEHINWRIYLITHAHKEIITENFLEEFKNYIDWAYITVPLSEDTIRKYQDKVDWTQVVINQKLSENFMREFQHKLDWSAISFHQDLSEDFIREFYYKVDWNSISRKKNLSENFIREFRDKVNWETISIHQTLSEDFIREFQDKVDWKYIYYYQTLSEPFFIEMKEYFNDIAKNDEYKHVPAKLKLFFIQQNKENSLISRINKSLKSYYISLEDFYKDLINNRIDNYVEIIHNFHKELNWYEISIIKDLSKEIISHYYKKINWELYFKTHKNIDKDFLLQEQFIYETDIVDYLLLYNIIKLEDINIE